MSSRLLFTPLLLAALLALLSAPAAEGKQLSIGRCWTCPTSDTAGALLELPEEDELGGEVSDMGEVEELTCFYESGAACVYSAFTGTLDLPEDGCAWKAKPQPCSSLQQLKRAEPAKRSPAPRAVEGELEARNPAPSKRAPAPSKRAPAPSKRAPAPSKRAPAPSKRAPAPSARSEPGNLASRALSAASQLQRSAGSLVRAFQARWSWAVGKTEDMKREASSAAEMVARKVEEREAMYALDD